MPKRRPAADIAAEQEILRAELVALDEKTDDDTTDDDVARAAEALSEFEALEAERKDAEDYEKRISVVRSRAAAGAVEPTTPEVMRKVDPFNGDPVEEISRSAALSRANKALEGLNDVYDLDERTLSHLERSLRMRTRDFDGDYLARRLLLTENDAYRAAFMKYTVFGAGAALTSAESDAVSRFQQFEMARAMNEGTTTAGGFGVPFALDPSIILTSGALDAPILRIARIVQTTTKVWQGVSSAGMTWSWDNEAAAVSDDSPAVAQPTVTNYMARGYIPYSIEVGMDYPGFASEMEMLLRQGYVDLLAVATVSGNGTSQPRGILTALDANASSEVVTTTDGQFGGVDIFKVWNALKERDRGRSTWLMNVAVESTIRQFATGTNSMAYFTVDLTAGGISAINGRPVVLTDYMPSGVSGVVPGTTGASNILIVGNFQNYVVSQRAGMSIEQIPHVFDTTSGTPTGQRGWFAWARAGANSVNDTGLRLLQNQ